jgi:ubiquinone/menaquinone biosynthesis C-methylase UbiE
MAKQRNEDLQTVEGFGREWTAFSQAALDPAERQELFAKYFCLIDWSHRPHRALDMGCGSGRWSVAVAPLVDELVLADASPAALDVARRNVRAPNTRFVESTPETLPFPDQHFDLIFSLGVLHHLPDTAGAIRSLARKLAPGGTLLLYLYYAFDNRPMWFRRLWTVSDVARRLITRLPFPVRRGIAEVMAACIYWPLARFAKYVPVGPSWPLYFYAERSFYVMRTDALDRFGTKLEQRFTRRQIAEMLTAAGLDEVRFGDLDPYWLCTARKPRVKDLLG